MRVQLLSPIHLAQEEYKQLMLQSMTVSSFVLITFFKVIIGFPFMLGLSLSYLRGWTKWAKSKGNNISQPF